MEQIPDRTAIFQTCGSSEHQNNWIDTQDALKKRLVTKDDFTWRLPSSIPERDGEGGGGERKEVLKYVGGVDISFSKEDPSIACGTLVVLDLQSFNVVYADFSVARLHIPYIPGFLAFREAPILWELLKKMKKEAPLVYPQLLMVDGNGLLHPRGFGLACHLGVLADIPTIGIGKNLHHVEGLTQLKVRELLEDGANKEFVDLIGDSGCTLGVAMRATLGALKPIFVSIGHRISLSTAVKVVKLTCKYRVPEPIRQADMRSRDYLRRRAFIQSNS
ncbi:hypothetical protein Nepgr_013646 [Nepenthes gracilis]|uniref:Endonuclease V n=1 Tax=Nepenthes gracilis TaxID=150966 RepID=A0AAD3XPL6_NEPGR|nr:hypothetical protein Nepgr_013646 [Nepenthes gracilis]